MRHLGRSSSQDQLLEHVESGHGLRENPSKTQIIGCSKLDQEVLRDGGPQNLKDSVTILGASSVNRPRRMSDQEETRLSEAKKRAILLKSLGWSLHVKAFAAFVLSKAAYGWVGRNPTKNASHLLMS